MSMRLFAYGTLRAGLAPPEIAEAVARLQPLGKGAARGRLYDLGAYPGAVFALAGNETAVDIEGEVYEVPDAGTLRRLDAYEGFEADNPDTSLFIRRQIEVRMVGDGESVGCWAYEYNWPVEGMAAW